MTAEKIALRELLEKGSDATFLCEMIGFAAYCPESEVRCSADSGAFAKLVSREMGAGDGCCTG